jgi:HAD superfamily hydrolase (TIGR01509 family)
MFDAVIFDWDGTLANTKRIVVASFEKVLKESPFKVADGFIESRLGTSAREIFGEILGTSKMSFDEEIIKDLVEKRMQAEMEMSGQVRLNAGALDLLRALRVRVKLALATMNNKPVIDYLLKACEVSLFFDVVLSADEVVKPKPDPEIFLKCASRLVVFPERCVVVEDSLFGVRAAKAARMTCIVVLTGSFPREALEQEHTDLIVASLADNKPILDLVLGLPPQ